MTSSAHVHEALGAYVLGALEDGEAAAVRAHLDECPRCRAEHDRLAAVPELLALVPQPAAVEAATPAPPEPLEEAVLHDFRERHRTRRRFGGLTRRLPTPVVAAVAAVAGAAAAVAGLAAVGAFEDEPSLPAERVVTLAGPAGSAKATVGFRPGGARLWLQAENLRPTRAGENYEVWFVGPAGRISAGSFQVGRHGEVDLYFYAAADPKSYDRLGVTLEPDGLDPARNGPSVLSAPLRS